MNQLVVQNFEKPKKQPPASQQALTATYKIQYSLSTT